MDSAKNDANMIEDFLNIDDIGGADMIFNSELESSISNGDANGLGGISNDSTFTTDSLLTSDSVCYSFQCDNPSIDVPLENNASAISFGSSIDDLYDPQIQSAHDDVMYHRHAADNARSYDDWNYHRHEETTAMKSEGYWIGSKFDAENEHMKVEAEREYQDFLNEQYSISHIENLYNDVYGRSNEISFGSSDDHLLADDGSSSISFQGYQEDARNIAASELQNKLNTYHIYYPGTLSSDSTFGGWDRYTGQKIHDAIQNARNSGAISDTIYKELMRDLKKACYFQ